MNKNIKNIIFDFGRVILNLNEEKTITGLENLLKIDFKDFYNLAVGDADLHKYETGQTSSKDFIKALVKIAPEGTNAEDIIAAWNAMLGDVPFETIELLKELRTKYRIFLLSNTNELHVNAFEANMKKQGIKETLQELFEEVWYSNEIGMRKPHTETYTKLMNSVNIKPEETLFLDDRQENLDGAIKAGLNVQLITDEYTTLDFFKDNL